MVVTFEKEYLRDLYEKGISYPLIKSIGFNPKLSKTTYVALKRLKKLMK